MIEALIQSELSKETFPGIVLLVEKDRRIVISHTAGDRQVKPTREVMTSDTIFDLASMTKPLATALLTLNIAGRRRSIWVARSATSFPVFPTGLGE